jgi:hypothetical protein
MKAKRDHGLWIVIWMLWGQVMSLHREIDSHPAWLWMQGLSYALAFLESGFSIRSWWKERRRKNVVDLDTWRRGRR